MKIISQYLQYSLIAIFMGFTHSHGSMQPYDDTDLSYKKNVPKIIEQDINNYLNYELPNEIWEHISSFLDFRTNLHRTSHLFFSLITDYPISEVSRKGFDFLKILNEPSRSKIQGAKINCQNIDCQKLPTFVWYSFISAVTHFDGCHIEYLKFTRIKPCDDDEDTILLNKTLYKMRRKICATHPDPDNNNLRPRFI